MQIVRTISTEIDKLKNRVVKILRFGKHDVQTAKEAMPFGIDSNPVANMVAIYSPTGEKGEGVIIGYFNKNQLADVGEFRTYSTDTKGVQKFYTWLKSNGTMEIGGNTKNMVRFQELEAGFNELKTDLNNLITAFNSHMHPTAGSGSPSPPTPIPNSIPALASSASISGAKIDEIKTL